MVIERLIGPLSLPGVVKHHYFTLFHLIYDECVGKLKIIEKGSLAVILLLDEKNQLFAVCPVNDEGAVDRTVDSGRYFILRIENKEGKRYIMISVVYRLYQISIFRAFIGIAFNERNDAFDFNVTLSEYKAQRDREKQADLLDVTGASSLSAPLRDLTLKEGEKVKINIATTTGRRKDKATVGSSAGGLLPPPGSGGKPLLAPPSTSAPAPVLSVFHAPSTSTSTADPFGFSSSDPFTSSTT